MRRRICTSTTVPPPPPSSHLRSTDTIPAPPFNSSNNPYTTTTPDPYLDYPYDCCGPNDRWTYPCRGYTSLLNTPAGLPTATWPAGSTQTWNISGIGNHYGGSCQVSFSTDGGKTFRVATSYEGNCPHRNDGLGPAGQDFDMVVPKDMPLGTAVFAWVWYNREQEFNTNCAAVNITAAGGDSSSVVPAPAASAASASPVVSAPSALYTTVNNCTCTCDSPVEIQSCNCSCPADNPIDRRAAVGAALGSGIPHEHSHNKRTPTSASSFVAFSDRPEMLVADDGNGCLTPKTTAEVKYPEPGPDVVLGDGVYPLQLPNGACARPGPQAYDGAGGDDGHAR